MLLSENEIDRQAGVLVDQIETTGYGVVDGVLDAAVLEQARRFVHEAVGASSGAYVGFNGSAEMAGSGLDVVGRSNWFRALTDRVYEIGTGQKAPAEDYSQIMRCFTGRSAAEHSYVFHYDSYVLTVLLPIEIPVLGQTGDLVMLPNRRGIRSSYAMNFFDKLVLDNKLTQYALRTLHSHKRLPVTRLHLVPGSAYFFWGYRSIHTNEPCDPGSVRATALYHFANPHADSALYKRRRAHSKIAA